jgi:hypothetical protein
MMRRSRWRTALTPLVVTALITVPVAVTAATRQTGEGAYPVSRQAFQWRTDPTATTSSDWQPLVLHGVDRDGGPALAGAPIVVAGRGGMTVTLSADFSGAPVELRVRDNRRILRPGRAKFSPRARGTSTSFTFVAPPQPQARCHAVHVEWRSPTGERVTFNRGDVVVTYRPEALDGAGCG